MGRAKPVILLEFNELSPVLMAQFIQEGHLPNFKTLFEQSEVFITDAEEEPPYLEPWIQWVTVHTGLPYEQHKVFSLDQGHRFEGQWIWDLISAAGHFVWLCGSMNIGYGKNLNGIVIPDPWSTQVKPYPEKSLSNYLDFIKKNVQEYSNQKMKNTISDAFRFLNFMLINGLSGETSLQLLKQLASEIYDRKNSWRRAFNLDMIQFDLFKCIYKKTNPVFSTLFSNSVAHMQHVYWRYMEPDKFKSCGKETDREKLGSAILSGYQANDKLLGKMLHFLDKEATLIFCTALSQQPCLLYEEISGKQGYRPYNIEKLLRFANISDFKSCSPVMSEQFRVNFKSAKDTKQAQVLLESLKLDNTRLMLLTMEDNSLVCGCGYFGKIDKNATVVNSENITIRFDELFYPLSEVKSGMHHPDGMLWIQHPKRQHHFHEGKVAITRIAPTILELLSIPKPTNIRANSLELSWVNKNRKNTKT